MAARMAILKAARQLAVEANLHVHIRKFSVINQVGAVGIDAKLDCDAFASTHSATSHYDRASFVGACSTKKLGGPSLDSLDSLTHCMQCTGLAWRPGGEAVCCEIYSTGKANLPGSTRQRDLLTSFARMVSELLRHSDKPEVCERIPERLRLCHRPKTVTRDDAPVVAHSKAAVVGSAPAQRVSDLFGAGSDWALEPLAPEEGLDDAEVDADASDGEDLPELADF